MTESVRPRGVDSTKIIQVIETRTSFGSGTKDDICREIVQYWDFDGSLIAKIDPLANNSNFQWFYGIPNLLDRCLYQVTIKRLFDNKIWVQDMIWNGYSEKWLWCDDPEDIEVDEKLFEIIAWSYLPSPAEKI